MTRQRKIILETLRSVRSHPTADELYTMVRKQLPRISLGTVYRNLELLSSEGEVHTLDSVGTRKRYDGNTDPHYHVQCVKCERLGDLPAELVPVIDVEGIQTGNFRVSGHQLAFTGLCAQCQEEQENVTSES